MYGGHFVRHHTVRRGAPHEYEDQSLTTMLDNIACVGDNGVDPAVFPRLYALLLAPLSSVPTAAAMYAKNYCRKISQRRMTTEKAEDRNGDDQTTGDERRISTGDRIRKPMTSVGSPPPPPSRRANAPNRITRTSKIPGNRRLNMFIAVDENRSVPTPPPRRSPPLPHDTLGVRSLATIDGPNGPRIPTRTKRARPMKMMMELPRHVLAMVFHGRPLITLRPTTLQLLEFPGDSIFALLLGSLDLGLGQ
jgi:hypothetical protein